MGGGTYAIDLNTNRVLASIWYWNYGDYNPISHHLCAFPSADPYQRLRVRQQHPGRQELPDLRHSDQHRPSPAPGFNIYRVRYDGAQMELIENVSETTGLGLGVHVTVNPKDAQSYFVTDGQKDIAACFDRTTSRVMAALQVRLEAQSTRAARVLEERRHAQDLQDLSRSEATGKYDYLGTKGQKIEWEMVPMGELFVEEGTIPAMMPLRSDRRRRHDLASERPLGGDGRAAVRRHRHPRRGEQLRAGGLPAVQQGLAGPISGRRKIDNDHWEVTFDKIFSPGHEIGFSPDGRFLLHDEQSAGEQLFGL